MSTFDGLIREFPTVAIDNFRVRPGVKIYLLSHVHSDHLAGLATETWDAPIYCSPITAKWLPMLATRSKQIAFETGKDQVLCRKFLLQDDRSCILYTGDARNEAVDLQGLRALPAFSSSLQPIDRLYLDTTCCHPAFEKFPSRDFAISDLVTFINSRPRLAHYYIDAWTFGYEDIWIGLSKAFHTKIHVSPYLYELYKAIDDMISPRILPHLTVDGSTARFHSCRLDKTCGYGGAGGEHAGSRMLIRIQPNVAWFSPLLHQGRQDAGEDGILAQGTVVGRGNTFKIKERLPPSIGKRDDLFYYFHYACHASLSELQQLVELVSPQALFPCVLHRDATTHTLFRSNREIVTLLAPHMPQQSSLDVEEYRDREALLTDGVTTDFQRFHHAKGYHYLDMSDKVLGVATSDVEPMGSRAGQQGTTLARNTTKPLLSPRSSHLRKKMDKLKRQLRNTASLEDEEEESSLEDGPLSMDLALVEKKRKRLSSCDVGQNTTQETTREELSDLQSSAGQASGDPFSASGLLSTSKTDDNRHQQEGESTTPWYDQSTVELCLTVLVDLEKDDDVDEEESSLAYDRSTDVSRTEPATPEGYMTSSPDSILSSLGPTESSPTDTLPFKSAAKSGGQEGDANKLITLSSDISAFLSLPTSASAVAAAPEITPLNCLYSIPPSASREHLCTDGMVSPSTTNGDTPAETRPD
ncbi:hypothetical protein BGX33_003499 [Mortierella sp. NVP41]|nr:hypothetical protein BGX33_003499 [Mortierella sp. NVP41]